MSRPLWLKRVAFPKSSVTFPRNESIPNINSPIVCHPSVATTQQNMCLHTLVAFCISSLIDRFAAIHAFVSGHRKHIEAFGKSFLVRKVQSLLKCTGETISGVLGGKLKMNKKAFRVHKHRERKRKIFINSWHCAPFSVDPIAFL